MKKMLFLVAAVLLAAPTATFAQKTTVTRVNREKTYKTSSHDLSIWYQGELNFGYGLGGKVKYDGEKADAKFSRAFIETVHGVRITQYAFAGMGLGFQYAYDGKNAVGVKEDGVGMMPMFLDLKGYYPVTETFAPYVAIDLGYGLPIFGAENDGEKLKGGFYASYGIGLNYKKLNFGLGWQHQGFHYEYEGEKSDGFGVNSFFVKVGVKF